MKLKIGKFELEGMPDEILAFCVGYELRNQFRDIFNDILDNSLNDHPDSNNDERGEKE